MRAGRIGRPHSKLDRTPSHERVTEPVQGWTQRHQCYSPPACDAEAIGNLHLTAATGLKRLGFILLAVVGAGLLVLTTAGYLISAELGASAGRR